MPTFNILLAKDVTNYGMVSAEGDTWEEAVASLTLDDWDECFQDTDDGWEHRVVHVEDEIDGVVAEDINYRCAVVHYVSVIQRLRKIQNTPGRVPCMVMDAAIDQYIAELEAMPRDPIFKKEGV